MLSLLPPLLLLSCVPAEPGPPAGVDLSPLALRWVFDGGLDAAQLRSGIDWNLGLLGATPPADGRHLDLQLDGQVAWITLDLAAAGFSEAAGPALTDALVELRAAAEADPDGAVDVGRVLMMTLHEPWRYYSITGACGTLADWEAARHPAGADRYDVVFSLLSGGDRMVLLPPEGTPVETLAFSVATSIRDLDDPDWAPEEFETVDLLPNSQQRFATYDAQGRLQPYADPQVVAGGQPGRCAWCHEGNLMYGSAENPSGPDAISYETWEARILDWQAELDAWRTVQESSIRWEDRDAHTWAERVVRDFLHPTPDRAAVEWGLSAEEAAALIAAEGLALSEDEEWPDRGEVLLRHEVDELLAARTGHRPPAVLADAREVLAEADYRGAAWADWMRCE